jgi:hypothetical protein
MLGEDERLLSPGFISRIIFDMVSVQDMHFVQMREKVLHCALGFKSTEISHKSIVLAQLMTLDLLVRKYTVLI